MNPLIVESSAPVTLIAGGPVTRADLRLAQKHAPMVVAADGGADRALALGVRPAAVIGDFDSISAAAKAQLQGAQMLHLAEQETTDFDKALRSIRAPMVLALGVMGGRADHALAVLSGLVRHRANGGAPCVLLGPKDVVFAAPRHLRLRLPVGERLSLFPLAPVRGQSRGLRWPIDGLVLAPDGRIGTSNCTDARDVELTFDSDAMLVILPRKCLGAVLRAL